MQILLHETAALIGRWFWVSVSGCLSKKRNRLLAQGASESVTADLHQEILLISSTTTYPIGAADSRGVICILSQPRYMLPLFLPTSSSGWRILN